jgi:hypothetical protein
MLNSLRRLLGARGYLVVWTDNRNQIELDSISTE